MKVLGLVRADAGSESGALPDMALVEKMGALVEEYTKNGILLATDGLTPSSKGKRVKMVNGVLSVIDGPFTESKELVASYALMEVRDMDHALECTKRFLEVLGNGECELRPIFSEEDFMALMQQQGGQ